MSAQTNSLRYEFSSLVVRPAHGELLRKYVRSRRFIAFQRRSFENSEQWRVISGQKIREIREIRGKNFSFFVVRPAHGELLRKSNFFDVEKLVG